MMQQFLNTNPRNKLIFCANEIPGYNYIDLGYMLSVSICNRNLNIPIAAYDSLIKIVEANISVDSRYGKYIAISNIGILFEPQLEFNIRHILDSLSRNNILIICTEGEVDNSDMYFLSKIKGENIDISGLSYLKLEKQ